LEAFLRLWHDCSGAALIEYSFVIGFMIAMFVVGIALAGSWASSMWVRLLPALSP
jgi:Flp pilus assembly pilin Flp